MNHSRKIRQVDSDWRMAGLQESAKLLQFLLDAMGNSNSLGVKSIYRDIVVEGQN